MFTNSVVFDSFSKATVSFNFKYMTVNDSQVPSSDEKFTYRLLCMQIFSANIITVLVYRTGLLI